MVVITMNENAKEPTPSEGDRQPDPHLAPRRLYVRHAHLFARASYGLLLLLYLVGLVGVVCTVTQHSFDGREMAGAFLLLLFPLVVGTVLRTRAIYGSTAGLEVERWGSRRTVAWRQVGTPEYAWWSLNWVARVARVRVREEKERTILFFANERTLAELERMRAVYSGK
jgi:hypothetical protein